jgi:hypothetical protein
MIIFVSNTTICKSVKAIYHISFDLFSSDVKSLSCFSFVSVKVMGY